jgi:phenylacetic acid degradation operon negative regulatory protein
VLVRLGELFDISEGTLRVALSRMAADGEVVAADGWYDLSPRLLARQHHLDAGLSPGLRPWHGGWELVAVYPDVAGTRRTAILDVLTGLRLRPLRDGLWLRPDNLTRAWPDPLDGCEFLAARPSGDPAALAERLWDLPLWAERGTSLLVGLRTESVPARRFALAAAVARHLQTDPVLPPKLLPPGWPGPALRRAYRAYEAELNELLGQARADALTP